MADLFNITLESGNLTGSADSFDSAVADGGDLSNEAAAALAQSSRGLQCVIDDTTAIYGQKDISSPASDKLRVRYYIDPNTLTMENEDEFRVCEVGCDGSLDGITNLFFATLKKAVAGYHIKFVAREDDASYNNSVIHLISDAEHYVELYCQAAAGTGSVQMWIDGVDKETISNLDNADLFDTLDKVLLGAVAGLDATTEDTFYLDELRANDDGGEIGPRVAAPVMMYDYRRRRV